MGDGTTIGIWIGGGEQRLLEDFDATFNPGDSTWSRSKEIKRAMELHRVVEEELRAAGLEFGAEQSKRHWIRQAVRGEAAREARNAHDTGAE